MGKVRERQIILKTDQCNVLLELGPGGKFQARSIGWDDNRTFFEGDVRQVEVRNVRWVLPAFRTGRARHRLRPSIIFRPRSDGVTGYVTSSHGAATTLRDGVTGHLAGNQPVRSRQAIVSPMTGRPLRQRVAGPHLPSLDSPTGRSPRTRPSRSSRRSHDRLGTVTPSPATMA
jgi:hypothetical protein